MKITICHLYPYQMNLYGDFGNILAITSRCQWRGIEAEVIGVEIGTQIDFSKVDILFMGGGQDREQERIAGDLLKRGADIKNAADGGMTGLVICGGYQLFGKYFKTAEGKELPGIGVFNAYTEAGPKRLIGNIVVDCRDLFREWPVEALHTTLVGFENHSGQTFIESGKETKPIGKVIQGFGNNQKDRTEGAVYKNIFGSYLHGSLLPKNPWLADHLILTGLQHHYPNEEIKLQKLDDTLEYQAHQAAIERSKTAKTSYL